MKKKFYQITNKSFDAEGVKTYKELWNKVEKNCKGLAVEVQTEFKAVEKSENAFDIVMSTATEDRHGDIVHQEWDLKHFKKNPVFLDSHNYDSIEHILGRITKIKVEDGVLKGRVEFALENPKGMLAYKLAAGGFLNATSVGFIPLEFNDDGSIAKSELLEDSAVSVPANAEALFVKKKKAKMTAKKKKEKTIEEKMLEDIKKKKEERNNQLIKESLVVIQQLAQKKVDERKKKQMVNRVIKQLIKIK